MRLPILTRRARATRTIVKCEFCGAKSAHIYRTEDGRLEFQCAGCGREIRPAEAPV